MNCLDYKDLSPSEKSVENSLLIKAAMQWVPSPYIRWTLARILPFWAWGHIAGDSRRQLIGKIESSHLRWLKKVHKLLLYHYRKMGSYILILWHICNFSTSSYFLKFNFNEEHLCKNITVNVAYDDFSLGKYSPYILFFVFLED